MKRKTTNEDRPRSDAEKYRLHEAQELINGVMRDLMEVEASGVWNKTDLEEFRKELLKCRKATEGLLEVNRTEQTSGDIQTIAERYTDKIRQRLLGLGKRIVNESKLS